MASPLELVRRAIPAWKLGQGGLHLVLRGNKFTAVFGETYVEVAGLTSLADRPAEWFHIRWFFQVAPLFFLAIDLIVMAGNCFPRLFSLAAQLSESLSQPADHRRLINPQP